MYNFFSILYIHPGKVKNFLVSLSYLWKEFV